MSKLSAVAKSIRIAGSVRSLKKAGSEDARAMARSHLADVLGRGGGLWAKVGQLMHQTGGGEEFRVLADSLEPRPFEQVAMSIEGALGRPLTDAFEWIDERGIAASVSQVHKARLPGGREVAVKVLYPGIGDQLRAEIGLLRALPRPRFLRTAGIDVDGILGEITERLALETDLIHEAGVQQRFALDRIEGVTVPEVIEAHGEVLVQSWEDGVPLTMARTWPRPHQRQLGRTLLENFLHGLFVRRTLHCDAHEGNYRYRMTGQSAEVVVLDYGSTVELSKEESCAWMRLILAVREYDDVDPLACLAAAGFDPQILLPIRERLPALQRILFEPFTVGRPFDLSDWKLGIRVQELLGEETWCFRAAGPPHVLQVIRALNGLARQLTSLGCRLDWFETLAATCPAALDEGRKFIPEPIDGCVRSCSSIARNLRVEVTRGSERAVNVTLPASALDDIESIMEPQTLSRLEARGLKVSEIVADVRARGYPPGPVFTEHDEERVVTVRLL